jgi:hypothetical protein
LYHAPLPNVSENGVCWGTVMQPSMEELRSASLSPDWRQFLGSPFGNHTVNGKSRKFPKDLRKLYMALENKDKYPRNDLVAIKNRTFGYLLKESRHEY